jgi:hypothetical protein
MQRIQQDGCMRANTLLLALELPLDVSEWSIRFGQLYTIDRSVKQGLDPETRPVCFRYVGLRQWYTSRPSLAQTMCQGNWAGTSDLQCCTLWRSVDA